MYFGSPPQSLGSIAFMGLGFIASIAFLLVPLFYVWRIVAAFRSTHRISAWPAVICLLLWLAQWPFMIRLQPVAWVAVTRALQCRLQSNSLCSARTTSVLRIGCGVVHPLRVNGIRAC